MAEVVNFGDLSDDIDDDDCQFSTKSTSQLIESICGLITRLVAQVQRDQAPSNDTQTVQLDGFTENDLRTLISQLDSFQELPQLLDQCLPSIVSQLILCFSSISSEVNISVWASKAFYTLCKVRGAKIICRFFPSDVALLVNVISWLETQVPNEPTPSTFKSTWEQRYVVLLWLSILILVPFNLNLFGQEIDDRIYNLSLKFLLVPGKERDAAAIVLSKLVTRTDFKGKLLKRLYSDLSKTLSIVDECSNVIDSFSTIGCLQVLAQTLQLVDIESIQPYLSIHKTFLITSHSNSKPSNSQIAKFKIKNSSRLASKYMSLITIDDGNQFLPEEVEEILGDLFESLSHKDTIVRYAVAKSIARIAQLMQGQFEDQVLEIIEGVFQSFDQDVYDTPPSAWGDSNKCLDGVSADLWHGALLTLAELLRRQLIPVTSLPRLVSILKDSLTFEQRLLVHVIGTNIRDASCYVCWSLFRSYKDLPSEYLSAILQNMVQLACFDREINIRRAASASIQECIGRQEVVAIGDDSNHRGYLMGDKLDLIQTLDYNTIGQKARSFTTVASGVYDLGYTKSLTRFLIQRNHGIGSWDPEIRRLSAQCLGILSTKTSENFEIYINWLASVYANVKNSISEYEVRHGILYALGEIVGLRVSNGNKNDGDISSVELIIQTVVLPILESVTTENLQDTKQLYFAESFLHLLKSVVLFTEKIALDLQGELRQCCIDLFFQPLSPVSLSKVNLCLKLCQVSVKNEVVVLIERCSPAYITPDLINIWFEGVDGKLDTTTTSTFAAALGGIGEGYPEVLYQSVVNFLSRFITLRKNDALTRCEAVKSLSRLLLLTSMQEDPKFQIIDALIDVMDDYTTDSRGDVGSWSRLQAMSGFMALFQHGNSLLLRSDNGRVTLLKTKLFRLAGESQDKLRLLSYQCLLALEDATAQVLRDSAPKDLSWKIPSYFQFIITTILSKDNETLFLPYIKSFLLGLVSTTGAVHVARDSSEASTRELMRYMASSVRIFNTLIEFLKPSASGADRRCSGNDDNDKISCQFEQKTSLCALRTFEKFFDMGLIPPVRGTDTNDNNNNNNNEVQYHALYAKIYNLHINTKQFAGRVLPAIRCFEGISQLPCDQLAGNDPKQAGIIKFYSLEAMKRLVTLTRHVAPVVRERALESLFTVLQGKYNDIMEDEDHEDYERRVEDSGRIIELLEEAEFTNPPEVLAENAKAYMAYINEMFI